MPAHNSEIADALDEVADLLELEQANPFRVRAYRNAGRAVRGLGAEVAALLARGEELPQISGIGKDLADKITDLARTQRLPLLKELASPSRRIRPAVSSASASPMMSTCRGSSQRRGSAAASSSSTRIPTGSISPRCIAAWRKTPACSSAWPPMRIA